MIGFVQKRVPKKYGEFSDWFACIDHYMELYECEWKWTENNLVLLTPKGDHMIEFNGHASGEWNIPKAGEILISHITSLKLKKVKKSKKTKKSQEVR